MEPFASASWNVEPLPFWKDCLPRLWILDSLRSLAFASGQFPNGPSQMPAFTFTSSSVPMKIQNPGTLSLRNWKQEAAGFREQFH